MFCVLGCISLDVSSKFEAGKDGIWEDDNGLAQFSSMRALRMSFLPVQYMVRLCLVYILS